MTLDILLVDDEPQVLKMFKRILEKDYSVASAADSGTAIEMTLARNPRLVLMDVHLAHADPLCGVGCVSALRSAGFAGLICMITGDTSEKFLLKSAVAGADDYMPKASPMDLVAGINLIFERHQSQTPSVSEIPPDSIYLRILGFEPRQIQLLTLWHDSGYLDMSELSELGKIHYKALNKRFQRIREKLDVANNVQLARLLTAISIFETRRNNNGLLN